MISAWIWVDGGDSFPLGEPRSVDVSISTYEWDIPVLRRMTIAMVEVLRSDGERKFLRLQRDNLIPGDTYTLRVQLLGDCP